MTPTFKNLLEAQAYFHSEEVCRQHLEQSRWNGKPVCPYCGIDKAPYRLKGGKRYRCSDKDCKKTFSITTGTIFENTNIPLQKWYLAIYIASAHKKGISSLQLSRDIGITQKSAWFVLHRVREMLSEKAPVMLEGTVEVDETYVGGKEGNKHQSDSAKAKRLSERGNKSARGRGADKTMVLGFVERGGNLSYQIINTTSSKEIIPIVKKRIAKNSTMYTDELKAYRGVTKIGYKHDTVSHIFNEYVRGNVHTNIIEGSFSLLKRGIIGIYHSVSPKHLQRYCDEFSYRYNTRKKTDAERFHHSITQSEGKRLTYKRLIEKPKKD